MTASATITVNPLPADYALTSGGAYCGSGGVSIGIVSSDAGINYQLYRNTTSSGTVAVGIPASGTGSAISFGLQTVLGLYSVTATNTSTGCSRVLTATTMLSLGPVPSIIPVMGGGAYCAGGTGVAITMPASAVGVNYQLYLGSIPVGSPVAGLGTSISFGLQTTPGTYSVIATNATSGCTATMGGTVTITVYPAPPVFTVTGGGSYCAGGSGVAVGLSSSTLGVIYQLYRSGVLLTGITRTGTGAAISFGLQTAAGTYTIVARNASTFCTSTMSGSATIVVNTVTSYSVVGGGAYCSGGTGVMVGLSGSSTGVNYQLRMGTVNVGSPVSGTGTALSFGLQTVAGTYTVFASNPTTGCTANMTGSAIVTVYALPSVYMVTGGGSYCTGGAGVTIGLSGSQTGVSYRLWLGSSTSGSIVSGTGGAISFGLRTGAGTYTVIATNTAGCTSTMAGSATISINSLPTVFTLTGGGTFCTGGSGVAIGLAGSQTGVSYQLLRGTTTVGSPVAGTGTSISFGLQTVAGTYTVRATNASTGCTATMSGSTTISTLSAPTVCPMTGGGGYCAGGSGVAVGLGASIVGVNYQLYRGTTAVGSPVGGVGGSLSFGLQTVAGVYTAIATNSSGCSSTMSGSATVTVYSLPAAFTVTGGGAFCSGGTGVSIGLSGSGTGVSYRLYLGVVPVSSPMAGTGGALNFGLYTTAGTYTVIATNTTSGCTATMTGSATVVVNPIPTISGTIYTVAPAATITLTGSPSGGTWSSSATSVATIGPSTGVVTGVALGTTTITYTLSTGCFKTRSIAVTATGFRAAPDNPDPIGSLPDLSSLYVAPNPNHGTFSIKGQLGTGNGVEMQIVITNMLGQVVYSNNTFPRDEEVYKQITIADMTPGTYIVSLRAGNECRVFRVIVE